MEYHEISKTDFRNSYNIVKVFTSKSDIMEYLKTYKENNQAVAFGVKRKPRDITPSWFKEYEKRLNVRFEKIETRLDKIESRLDKHDQMFREHGWIK